MDKEQRIEKIKSLINELKELYGAERADLFLEYPEDYCDRSDEYVIRMFRCKTHTDGTAVNISPDDQRIVIE